MTTESRPRPAFDFAALGEKLEARLDDIGDVIRERALAEWPAEWVVDRPELREPMIEALRSGVLADLEAFKADLRLPDECPPTAAYHTRLLAEVGAGLEPMHWGLRVTHRALWGCWTEIVDDLDISERQRRELLRLTSDFFFEYADRIWIFVKQEYTAHRERVLRGSDQRRAQIIHELLAGQDVDVTGLDYDMEVSHLAIITWGPRASQVARELARAANRDLLLVSLPNSSIFWAWLGGSRPLDKSLSMLDSFEPSKGTALAVGEEETGLSGFRRSHQLAGYAQRAGRASRCPVTRYRDVAIEALAGHDEREARAFVARELAGLDGDDKRSVALRKTLLTYFGSGHNAAATAAALGVHEQTVANRLNTVAERIGARVNARRCELETALRLREYLGDRQAPASYSTAS
ncbi:MAG: helix-turn-helix domain-containing protein [Solirubrobacterales bacterium]